MDKRPKRLAEQLRKAARRAAAGSPITARARRCSPIRSGSRTSSSIWF